MCFMCCRDPHRCLESGGIPTDSSFQQTPALAGPPHPLSLWNTETSADKLFSSIAVSAIFCFWFALSAAPAQLPTSDTVNFMGNCSRWNITYSFISFTFIFCKIIFQLHQCLDAFHCTATQMLCWHSRAERHWAETTKTSLHSTAI